MVDCSHIRVRNLRGSPAQANNEDEGGTSRESTAKEYNSYNTRGLEHGSQDVERFTQANYTNAVSLVPAALKTSFTEMLDKNDAMPELAAISLALAWQKGDYKTAPSQL